MHHEQYPEFQSDYKSDVVALVGGLNSRETHFRKNSRKLLGFDRSIFNVKDMNDIGFQFYTVLLSRASSQEADFTATMHKTNLKLFKVSG